jgi:pimeloyl-ACP methyl ester carboxylesterase
MTGLSERADEPTRRRFLQMAATSSAGLLTIRALKPLESLAAPPAASSMSALEPFRINISQAVLDDLQTRLGRTRWPDEIDDAGWNYGTNCEYLQALTLYWRQNYDWRAQESKLNQFPQFTTDIDGIKVHFLHVQGKGPNPMPLLLTHGWPDSFFRFVKLIPLLTDPVSHGGRAEDAFTVVVPDIPGFGFSQKPTKPGWDTVRTADLFAQLMTNVLGYKKVAAHGGDFGASITEQLALHHPEILLAIHLTNVPPQHALKANPDGLSPNEKAYIQEAKSWGEKEGAFTHIQNTKPQTLSFGLNDSPVGLCAWIIEKFHAWSDSDGQLQRVFTQDEVLTNVMIYWVTQTIGSSMRFYYEKAHLSGVAEPSYVKVPTGFAAFAKDITPAPRQFAERYFNIQRWTEMPHGGHFAALEVPVPLTIQLREFFGPFRSELA